MSNADKIIQLVWDCLFISADNKQCQSIQCKWNRLAKELILTRVIHLEQSKLDHLCQTGNPWEKKRVIMAFKNHQEHYLSTWSLAVASSKTDKRLLLDYSFYSQTLGETFKKRPRDYFHKDSQSSQRAPNLNLKHPACNLKCDPGSLVSEVMWLNPLLGIMESSLKLWLIKI